MDRRYREELEQVRLTEESKRELVRALEARRPAPRRQIPLRRVAALAACAGLVLGLVNYQAVAAGTERVIRYFLGVGAAEEDRKSVV